MGSTYDCCNDVCRFPWIAPFTPGEPNQEYSKTASKKNKTDIVETGELLPFGPILVKEIECWWVVEEKEQDHRQACDDDV